MTRTNFRLQYLSQAIDNSNDFKYFFSSGGLALAWSVLYEGNYRHPGRRRKLIAVIDYGMVDTDTLSIVSVEVQQLSYTYESIFANKILSSGAILTGATDNRRHASEVWELDIPPGLAFAGTEDLIVTLAGGDATYCRIVLFELVDFDQIMSYDVDTDSSGSSDNDFAVTLGKFRGNAVYLGATRRSNEGGSLNTGGVSFETHLVESFYTDTVYRIVSGQNPTGAVTFGTNGDSNAIRGFSWLIAFI